MKKKYIGIDIDCVIADTIKMFIPFFNERFNQNLELNEIKHYEFEKCYKNVDADDIMQAFKDITKKKLWADIKPMKGADNFLKLLSEKYCTVIVTSRPEEFMGEQTELWLNKHKFKYDKLLYMKQGDKDKYITGLNNGYKFDLMIEDCLDFALKISKYKIPVLLYDYPCNQLEKAPENIVRIYNLKEALKIILNDKLI
ncbi:hypothetical protein KA977_15455 [Candidatus Dependentiae bacterium]|nr:hypothetical protein [Candidatus Dependentiae bacterium]